jgi:hypothetical protein
MGIGNVSCRASAVKKNDQTMTNNDTYCPNPGEFSKLVALLVLAQNML